MITKTKYLIFIIFIWTALVAFSFYWNYYETNNNLLLLVENKAASIFNQIEIFRSWNAKHGGVYVPIKDGILPNPYLKDSLRDLTATNGIKLTKINPAYMTRQLAEMNSLDGNIELHITSLNPIRPANKADKWETEALKSFETGNKSILKLIENDSISVYKYMSPLFVKKPCLTCHEFQGYKVGDIRGGISVSFVADVYKDLTEKQIKILSWIHLFVFFAGIICIIIYSKLSKKHFSAIHNKNIELTKNEILLQKQAEDLLLLNSKKDKYFSIIAHDLRNPFQSLIGLSELLLNENEEEDKTEFRNLLLQLNKTSVQTFQLLENLLEWAQSEMGRSPFNPKQVDLLKMINENVELCESVAKQKNINIISHLKNSIIVNVDENMINTIIRNLLTNAIKFSHPDNKIEIFVTQDESFVTTTVQDFGVGDCMFKNKMVSFLQNSLITI